MSALSISNASQIPKCTFDMFGDLCAENAQNRDGVGISGRNLVYLLKKVGFLFLSSTCIKVYTCGSNSVKVFWFIVRIF